MKQLKRLLVLFCAVWWMAGCAGPGGDPAGGDPQAPPSQPQSSSQPSSGQSTGSAAPSEAAAPEDSLAISMKTLGGSTEVFPMKRGDTAHGWTLTEVEPFDTPAPTEFKEGVLTFTGTVEVTGTVTHVNAIYDGFEFVPAAADQEKFLVLGDRAEKDFFLRILEESDPSVLDSFSALAIGESGAYTLTLTQYRLPHVPMMAVNSAVVSSAVEVGS